jgi:hypothetical protein
VVVSCDFDQQELANIAEQSQCAALLKCFVGDKLMKMHGITGVVVARRLRPDIDWSYDVLMAARKDEDHPLYKDADDAYNLGKKVNFTSEYGAMAPKLAATLLIPEDEAQEFLDGREASFPGVKTWKLRVVEDAKACGHIRTMLGAVRHLRSAFLSDDPWERSKAERQAVNAKVQGSCAEQTKRAEGQMWKIRLFQRYDAVCYGPIHDEVVASVRIDQLVPFLQEMHSCMTIAYAGMQVPIKSSISFGPDFYHQTEIGLLPTPEAIAKGLDDMWAAKAKREGKVLEAA